MVFDIGWILVKKNFFKLVILEKLSYEVWFKIELVVICEL